MATQFVSSQQGLKGPLDRGFGIVRLCFLTHTEIPFSRTLSLNRLINWFLSDSRAAAALSGTVLQAPSVQLRLFRPALLQDKFASEFPDHLAR
jgi:hypothetical protein